ncbi:hypothetical protein ARMGADRAFT_1028567 [Armillaria gallica]|uniref:Uncharacterized protein n=1 Tax=Armillaria gallica TaxID=47427 RepID=A0A2H3DWG5_ARMGA|nr:hypothetical protein ARMGADRAFT_1028567 [Armillaria gallica]
MTSETRRYKHQWQGYGSQSKTIPHPPPLIIRDVCTPHHEQQDRLFHDGVSSRRAVVLPPPSTYNGSHTTMTPSLPPYVDDNEVQLPPTYTSLRLKCVASQNQSIQIPTRYFFLYGFVCPPLWLLGILVLIHPLRHVLPFLFISGHNVETRSKEKEWASLCLIITSILSVVGTPVSGGNEHLLPTSAFETASESLVESAWIRTLTAYPYRFVGTKSYYNGLSTSSSGHKSALNVDGVFGLEADAGPSSSIAPFGVTSLGISSPFWRFTISMPAPFDAQQRHLAVTCSYLIFVGSCWCTASVRSNLRYHLCSGIQAHPSLG